MEIIGYSSHYFEINMHLVLIVHDSEIYFYMYEPISRVQLSFVWMKFLRSRGDSDMR